MNNEWLARAFTLRNDFRVTGAAVQQQQLKRYISLSTSASEVNVFSFQWSLTEAALESTGFCFLTLHHTPPSPSPPPPPCPRDSTYLLLGAAKSWGSASISICGATLHLVFLSSSEQNDPKQAHFWVGN